MTAHRLFWIPRVRWRVERVRFYGVAVLAMILGVGTTVMTWIGYRALREWERSTTLSLERRAGEMLVLLAVALNRDMKGAQISVLVPIDQQSLQLEPPYDLAEVVARAFARFPYPESFFAWRENGTAEGTVYFFNRTDRPPAWDTIPHSDAPYPVVILKDPIEMRGLVSGARNLARYGKRFAALEWKKGPVTYHTIIHLLYGRPGKNALVGLFGFTVNLDWVRREYFAEVLRQVHGIGGSAGGLSLTVLDDHGQQVAAAGRQTTDAPMQERPFSLIFFEPSLVSVLPPGAQPIRRWVARVSAGRDPALIAAGLGAERAFTTMTIAAFATLMALMLIVRTVRTSSELAVLKSEFVSAVTHELKTPLSLIRLVGDTLQKGRYTSTNTIADYARLLSQESVHLTGLIDNLLTYARLSDVKTVYTFETLDVLEIVEDSLDRFRPRLSELEFDVKLQVPVDLPRVRGDRGMLVQVFDNLIDNAIKYADGERAIAITARVTGRFLHVEIADSGPGIPPDELPRVYEKFFRGRHVRKGGSGLGLAIARQVVLDHGGSVKLRSVLGVGTTVEIDLPKTQG